MVRFDTMTIAIPTDSIRGVRRESFVENQQTDLQTGLVVTTQQAKNDHLPIGVSKIQYKEGRDYLATISAKTLGQDYLEGINLNNWDKAIESISPILDIDINSLWEANPIIHRCDNTDNIFLSDIGHSKNEICRSLYSANRNERFIPKWYESKRKLGVEFFGTQQEKNRLIVYDKKLDLLKHQNKDFIKSIPNPVKMFNDAERTLRFETNHTSFRSMKNRFDVSKNHLQEMLNSQSKVNYNYLNKVLKFDFRQLSLYDELKNFEGKGIDFVMMKGYENIIKELNCDTIAVRQFFKELLGERSFKYYWTQVRSMPTIKEMVTKLKIEQEKQIGNLKNDAKPLTICNSVLEALRLAV
jgi:hypothetical protein